jgi:hypothetical protein
MCTLVMLRRPAHDWPVIVGANRDEMIDRAWEPPARHWPDRAETVGGRDALAGGSWLAVNEHGVVAGILNRVGSLGPQSGRRSRGELVLEALDHADAGAAAEALAALEPRSYRPFNLVIADNRDAFWLRHADPTGTLPITVVPLPEGISMLTAGDLDDESSPRVRTYLPRFREAAPPYPERRDWGSWEALLASGESFGSEPNGAMNFVTARGFGTVSSALIALPAIGQAGVRPLFRFATRRPVPSEWADVAV